MLEVSITLGWLLALIVVCAVVGYGLLKYIQHQSKKEDLRRLDRALNRSFDAIPKR